MKRVMLLAIVAVIFVCSLSACDDEGEGAEFGLIGTVTDSESQEPLGGVSILFNGGLKDVTNSSGYYTAILSRGKAPVGTLTMERDGYEDQSFTVPEDLTWNEARFLYELNVPLSPVEPQ